ncbi:hypothetical protein BKA58DRAFT_442011 [Alternaria rosae]|uniref:uncharacterized protein n=1 Tax=Alternaria rosae TaxID=1187941 RepID=UPI001E8EE1C8|nr:uncharacterized protein BKA58DRAFT_442011 [Alternaria rosae]KAH6867019.1 hypothetical protein BKA58DRAFT_442011 [Alternaria rosae]
MRDLEKGESAVDEATQETKRDLSISKEEDAWAGNDSDAEFEDEDIDYGDDEEAGTDADAEGDTDDENEIDAFSGSVFTPNADKDVVIGAVTQNAHQMLRVKDEQEKKDSPMTFKPGEDTDMDDEDSPEETKAMKVDEEDDGDMVEDLYRW